jgi:very-short-patch-repair endonuclease
MTKDRAVEPARASREKCDESDADASRGDHRVADLPSPARGRGAGGEGDATLLDRAKALRTRQTDAEQRLWYHLRAHRFMGLKFRRQCPVGRYIVDFMCLTPKLVIELDGGQHADEADYDDRRDRWLRAQGFTVLRFWNHDVLRDTDAVLERIRQVAVSLA